jgi:transcription elongation GreA/GreB family factor
MNTDPTNWRDPALLDDLFVSLAEGKSDAFPRLLSLLAAAPREPLSAWPPDVASRWREGLELAIEGVDRGNLRAGAEFLLTVCGIGFDTPAFRDLLAGMVRQTRSDYLDPTGLLDALGVRNGDVPTQMVAARWAVFNLVKPGALCFHPAHGLGSIEAVDGLSNEVRIRFQRHVSLALDVVLGQTVLIRPASWLFYLAKGEKGAKEKLVVDQFGERARAELVTAAPLSDDVLKAVLVPAILNADEVAALLRIAEVRRPAEAAGPVVATITRTWDQARGITEMVGLLAADEALQDSRADVANVATILRAGAERPTAASDFVEAVSRLQDAFGTGSWLATVLTDLASRAVSWNDATVFIEQTDKLPGRLMTPWFEATATARGAAYLAQATMALPLRLWSHSEGVVAKHSGDPQMLLATVIQEIGRGAINAYVLLWVYRNGGDARRLLANPPLLFKTLQRPVRGSFIKARKDLHKLLMDDQNFQRLIMRDGDADAIMSLVRAARHAQLLDSGERQSLLVKIVRVFPEAKSLVEDRRQQPTRKAVGKITSVRSFERRRRELEQIINSEIPANSRAIAHARSYGDLRENAEFKSAKERQAYLSARRGELEDDLHEVRATDFRDVVVTSTVIPGCTVTLRYADEHTEQFHVLGLWDSIPERRLVSYDTPFGRALLTTQVGDTIELPAGDTVRLDAVIPLSPELLDWVRDREAEA